MKDRVFVSDRIIGVYFTSVKNLEEYYKKATKIEGLSCGNVKGMFKDELNNYEKIKCNINSGNTNINNVFMCKIILPI